MHLVKTRGLCFPPLQTAPQPSCGRCWGEERSGVWRGAASREAPSKRMLHPELLRCTQPRLVALLRLPLPPFALPPPPETHKTQRVQGWAVGPLPLFAGSVQAGFFFREQQGRLQHPEQHFNHGPKGFARDVPLQNPPSQQTLLQGCRRDQSKPRGWHSLGAMGRARPSHAGPSRGCQTPLSPLVPVQTCPRTGPWEHCRDEHGARAKALLISQSYALPQACSLHGSQPEALNPLLSPSR